jgi:Fe-Mn family superoxide dismutase
MAPLPYDSAALEPGMSQRTFSFHYDKHYRAYADATRAQIAGTPLEQANLEAIVSSARQAGNRKLFNSSAQMWNHEFFWHSMAPDGGGAPSGALAALVAREFGQVDRLKQALLDEAVGHFGSGWTWLVLKDGRLQVTSSHDAETPAGDAAVTPLLTIDVWEHAYYLDHQNARAGYVEVFLDRLVNWPFAARNLERAQGKAA